MDSDFFVKTFVVRFVKTLYFLSEWMGSLTVKSLLDAVQILHNISLNSLGDL